MERKKIGFIIDIAIGVFIGLSLIAGLYSGNFLKFKDNEKLYTMPGNYGSPGQLAQLYGYDVDDYVFFTDQVKDNQKLGSILYWAGVPYALIDELVEISKDVFNVHMIRAGANYTLIRKDSCSEPISLVYEPDIFSYIVFHLSDSLYATREFKDVETKMHFADGIITSSLWNAMRDNGLEFALIEKMESALASEVDFYHAQKGDRFKLLFERKYIDGNPVATGNILGAAYFNDKENFAIYFDEEKHKGYYNLKGEPTAKSFLRSPVSAARISSGFSHRRLHPIHGTHQPHYGTDYAAPTGTPIMSVGPGVVIARGYGRGNGNYVTIKHDKAYTTSYLHMSRFAKGIHRGASVSRGQVIGYVGSTGLATGPHVCFRMKKNGRPINHLRERFAPPDPLPDTVIGKFFQVRDDVLKMMDEFETLTPSGREVVIHEKEKA